MKFDCEFLFAALAEKHNAVIRKIREIPPWEVPDGLYKPIAPNPWTLPGNANQNISFQASKIPHFPQGHKSAASIGTD